MSSWSWDCIDAGTIEPTRSKLCQNWFVSPCGANVVIGGCFLAARSGLSGSVEVGENTFIDAD